MKDLITYLMEDKFKAYMEIESTSSNPPLEYKNYGLMKRMDIVDDVIFDKLGDKFKTYYEKNKDKFDNFVFYLPNEWNKIQRIGLVCNCPTNQDSSKYYLLIETIYDDFFNELKSNINTIISFCKSNCKNFK